MKRTNLSKEHFIVKGDLINNAPRIVMKRTRLPITQEDIDAGSALIYMAAALAWFMTMVGVMIILSLIL